MLRRIDAEHAARRIAAVSLAYDLTSHRGTDLLTGYYMPKAAVFQQFAQQVGEQMSEAYSDSRYADQVVVDGLANFLKVVGELTVKRLNKLSEA